MGIGEIGKANRQKGQRPFFYSLPKRATASFCLGASNCRSDGGFGEKLRWRAYLRYVPIAVSSPKRRINGDFTRPAGVGKIDNVNFSEGGKTPFSKNTAQNCFAILLTIYSKMRDITESTNSLSFIFAKLTSAKLLTIRERAALSSKPLCIM